MKTLIVTLAGGLTCFLTAVLLLVLQEATDFSLYGLTVLLVVPVGAILAGMVGATGYYAGARLVGCRPTAWLALNMVLVSAATFFLIHYLTYQTSEFNGAPVRELVGFGEYLDLTVRNTVVKRARGGDNGPGQPLGVWGYPLAALKVVGFALGGLAVFFILADKPYCRPCGRFLAGAGRRTRYHPDADEAEATVGRTLAGFDAADAGHLQAALDAHATAGQPKAGTAKLRTTAHLLRCGGCGAGQARFRLEAHGGEHWVEVKEATRLAETAPDDRLELRDAPAGDPPPTAAS